MTGNFDGLGNENREGLSGLAFRAFLDTKEHTFLGFLDMNTLHKNLNM